MYHSNVGHIFRCTSYNGGSFIALYTVDFWGLFRNIDFWNLSDCFATTVAALDGVTVTPRSRGRALAWDFTCVHRLAASHMRSATLEGPVVANDAEEMKRYHYSDLPATCIFQPVALETLGGIGFSTWLFLKDLARRIQTQNHNKNSFAYLRQRLSLAVRRGNAACIEQSHSKP